MKPQKLVQRVCIPQPDGGVRKLGVPCVVDRLIQRALLQVLQAPLLRRSDFRRQVQPDVRPQQQRIWT